MLILAAESSTQFVTTYIYPILPLLVSVGIAVASNVYSHKLLDKKLRAEDQKTLSQNEREDKIRTEERKHFTNQEKAMAEERREQLSYSRELDANLRQRNAIAQAVADIDLARRHHYEFAHKALFFKQENISKIAGIEALGYEIDFMANYSNVSREISTALNSLKLQLLPNVLVDEIEEIELAAAQYDTAIFQGFKTVRACYDLSEFDQAQISPGFVSLSVSWPPEISTKCEELIQSALSELKLPAH